MPSLIFPITLLTQVALWTGYKYQLEGPASNFWGKIPKSKWTAILTAASIAYLLNLYLLINLSFHNLDKKTVAIVIVSVLFYYGMQMFFLPMVKHAVTTNGSRWPVRILLLACIVPFLMLAIVGIQNGYYISAILPLLHVAFTDALFIWFRVLMTYFYLLYGKK